MDRKKLVLLLGALVIAIGTALAARSLFVGAATPQAEAVPQKPVGPKVQKRTPKCPRVRAT